MSNTFFQPVSGMELPRFAGIPTFMRLPHVPLDHARFAEVEVGIIGVPWDSGTTNRPGPRHGPRQLRRDDFESGTASRRASHRVGRIRRLGATL